MVSADQAAASLELEAGPGAQRHNGVSGSAAWTAADQAPSGGVDSGYHRVYRDCREQLASVVNSADDGGFGRDLNLSAEKARTEDRPADGRPVEYEIPREEP